MQNKPFEPVKRKSRSAKERAGLFKLRGGICYFCKGKIHDNEAWDWIHIKALGMGGDDTIDNSDLGHKKCHRGTQSPTSQDQSQIADAKRKEAKRFNFIRPKQSIQSAGFTKTIKPQKLTKSPLPPRALYKDTM